MWEELEPIITNALAAVIPAAAMWAVAWFRMRTQRQVVQRAAEEAEAEGSRHGLPHPEKKELALTLSSTRMGLLTRPSPAKLDAMVDEAQRSVPPPKPKA